MIVWSEIDDLKQDAKAPLGLDDTTVAVAPIDAPRT